MECSEQKMETEYSELKIKWLKEAEFDVNGEIAEYNLMQTCASQWH